MVHFQRYDGTSAEIDPMWTTPDYRINEISEAEWDRGEELEARLLGSLATILSDPDLQRLVIETPEYYLIRPQLAGVQYTACRQRQKHAWYHASMVERVR
jgi:hypothetical protein